MRPIKYQEFPSNRRFGIELELSNNLTKSDICDIVMAFEETYDTKKAVRMTAGDEGWAQTKNNAYWHVKFDRTCGPRGKQYDSGWEVASYIGMGINDVYHMSRLARFLRIRGAEVNSNCGYHIHVETKDYDTESMGRLMARWLKVERYVLNICDKSRRNNEWCQPLRLRHDLIVSPYCNSTPSPNDLWLRMCPHDYNPHNNYDKRYSVNTVGFAAAQSGNGSRNTVELRLPECLLEETHVKNWLRLFVNFVETAKSGPYPDDLSPSNSLDEAMGYLGLSGSDNFWILDKELMSTKIWFLQKLMTVSGDVQMAKAAKKKLEFIARI